MRGKLYSYKNQSGRQLPPPAVAAAAAASGPGHMNLAAYQAFALQQRAILQHALTYESLMQNAASVTSSQFMHQMGAAHTSVPRLKDGDVTITTSTSASNAHESCEQRDENNLPQKSDDVKLEQVRVKLSYTLDHTILTFNDPVLDAKQCGKKRKRWKPAFSDFSTVFSALPTDKFQFFSYIISVICIYVHIRPVQNYVVL